METVHEIFEALDQLVSRNKREGQKSAENENLKRSTVLPFIICKLRLVDYIKYFTKTLKGMSFEIPPAISTSSKQSLYQCYHQTALIAINLHSTTSPQLVLLQEGENYIQHVIASICWSLSIIIENEHTNNELVCDILAPSPEIFIFTMGFSTSDSFSCKYKIKMLFISKTESYTPQH
ncbi:hypothetical protein P5673_007266 [Acropora cervicornis]|uniref:Uncharacterized protein n=1 Tax=Acropora cervicornis TaxID=6130 RepID=A0AAD9QWC2_ACRCE|nr:hypothetical protein P5673_007266 [Acropora cervicornis]